jgi:dephospho-CoA kinase
MGIAVIDADLVTREVYSEDSDCLRELTDAFTDAIIGADGAIDRKMLGRICFSDRDKLLLLGKITHPYITKRIDDRINELTDSGANVIVIDAPALYESGFDKRCGVIVLVTADKDCRVQRIMERDNITEYDALLRINAQPPDGFYAGSANHIIRNNGGIKSLEEKVHMIFAQLSKGESV